jgi:hypothetical protein
VSEQVLASKRTAADHADDSATRGNDAGGCGDVEDAVVGQGSVAREAVVLGQGVRQLQQGWSVGLDGWANLKIAHAAKLFRNQTAAVTQRRTAVPGVARIERISELVTALDGEVVEVPTKLLNDAGLAVMARRAL